MSSTQSQNECPICMEEDNLVKFSKNCDHMAHIECVKQLKNSGCPICRKPIDSEFTGINEKIKQNSKHYSEKLSNESIQNILSRGPSANEYEIPPEFEIQTAVKFLKGFGIPIRFYPLEVEISISVLCPAFPRGVFFQAYMNEVFRRIHEALGSDAYGSPDEHRYDVAGNDENADSAADDTIDDVFENKSPFELEDKEYEMKELRVRILAIEYKV